MVSFFYCSFFFIANFTFYNGNTATLLHLMMPHHHDASLDALVSILYCFFLIFNFLFYNNYDRLHHDNSQKWPTLPTATINTTTFMQQGE